MTLRPALLIGGRSSRMGTNKSELRKDGHTLGFFLARLLQAQTGIQPVLLGEGDIGDHTDEFQLIPDPEKGRGPLAGLMGFAQAFPQDDLLLLPTDLYAMDERALAWLLAEATSTEKAVIWPKQPQRRHGEPLAAIYKATCFDHLDEAWHQGKGSPCQAIQREWRHEPEIPEHLRLAFVNINTPEDLESVKRGLDGQLNQVDRERLFPTSVKRAHS